MIESILNMALLIIIVVFSILWIKALVNSDGHCHLDSCDGCMYQGHCPEEK